jgi:hypothetical protein
MLFPIPLWHGTSAHLLPLIKEHGLGGRNVMADWNVMEFLASTFPHLKVGEFDFADPDYPDLMPIRSAIGGGAAGMNFEYGHVYLAGGYDRAADYAQNAPELVSFAKVILDAAQRRGIGAVQERLASYPELEEFLMRDPAPVVLKLPPVPFSWIKDEKGGEKVLSSRDLDDSDMSIWSQVGFRLTEVIPFDGIEIIDARDHECTWHF